MDKRTCKKCGVEKPIASFGTNNRGTGPRWECRKCRSVYRRFITVRVLYGITKEIYDRHLKFQTGGCAICKQPCSSGKALAVDHNHSTGELRGLLCSKCNHGIGQFKDNPELLREAALYLETTTYRIERAA